MSTSPNPPAASEETIRIRPRRRTRPRRIGLASLPFWWLARRTRRIRPLLWGIAYTVSVSAFAVGLGALLLSAIGGVSIPATVVRGSEAALFAGLIAIVILRMMGVSETPEDWTYADVHWLDPRPWH